MSVRLYALNHLLETKRTDLIFKLLDEKLYISILSHIYWNLKFDFLHAKENGLLLTATTCTDTTNQ